MKTQKERTQTRTKRIDKADTLASLRKKLTAAEPEIQHYIVALEVENLRFQKHIAGLQASCLSLSNRIKVPEEETNERCVPEKPPIKCSIERLENLRKLEQALRKK